MNTTWGTKQMTYQISLDGNEKKYDVVKEKFKEHFNNKIYE